jgi:hypothetical protein
MLRTLFAATILAGALAGSAMAQAPDAGCALPSEPEGIPAAIDAAITGPADKDRTCMKALLMPEARMMIVSLGADGAPGYLVDGGLDKSGCNRPAVPMTIGVVWDRRHVGQYVVHELVEFLLQRRGA